MPNFIDPPLCKNCMMGIVSFEGNDHTSKLEINLKPMPADNPQNGDDVAMLLTRCFFFSKQNYVFC